MKQQSKLEQAFEIFLLVSATFALVTPGLTAVRLEISIVLAVKVVVREELPLQHRLPNLRFLEKLVQSLVVLLSMLSYTFEWFVVDRMKCEIEEVPVDITDSSRIEQGQHNQIAMIAIYIFPVPGQRRLGPSFSGPFGYILAERQQFVLEVGHARTTQIPNRLGVKSTWPCWENKAFDGDCVILLPVDNCSKV